MLIIIQIAIPQ